MQFNTGKCIKIESYFLNVKVILLLEILQLCFDEDDHGVFKDYYLERSWYEKNQYEKVEFSEIVTHLRH